MPLAMVWQSLRALATRASLMEFAMDGVRTRASVTNDGQHHRELDERETHPARPCVRSPATLATSASPPE